MTNLWYLFVAYMIVWIGIWSYTLLLGKRQRQIAGRLENIESILSKMKKFD